MDILLFNSIMPLLIFLVVVSRTVAKFLKSALKTPKPVTDESSSTPLKNLSQFPLVLPRPAPINSMSKSMIMSNNESSQITNSDSSNESFQAKNSMSTSLYSPLTTSNSNEQKDASNSTESVVSTVPTTSVRASKIINGSRVLPVLDPNGDLPPPVLKRVHPEKKGKSFTDNLKYFHSIPNSCLP